MGIKESNQTNKQNLNVLRTNGLNFIKFYIDIDIDKIEIVICYLSFLTNM